MNAPQVTKFPAVKAMFAATALFNAAQTSLLKTYENGEFEHLLEHTNPTELADELENCGDGLLRYLMAELSDREDCKTAEDAIRRLDKTIDQLVELKGHLYDTL